MREIIGTKSGSLWAIGFNQMRNDERWIVVCCDCGRYDEITIEDFLNKNKICKNCSNSNLNEYIGKKFGRWTILEKIKNKRNMQYYKCICDCGTEKEIAISNLIQGSSKSCGCLRKELMKRKFD